MDPEEFLSALQALVGPQRGFLVRGAALLDVSFKTLQAVRQGLRPVPAAYVAKLREAERRADQAGACLPFVAARLAPVLRSAERAGWDRREALAAVAAWAALGLRDSV